MASLEDACRHGRLNKELRSKKGLQAALNSHKDRLLNLLERAGLEDQCQLDGFFDPPLIAGD